MSMTWLASFLIFTAACSSGGKGDQANKTSSPTQSVEKAAPEYGVGPVKEVNVGTEIDPVLAEKGQVIYEGKCTACHKFEERYVGPPLGGVTDRRNHAWIMNMIMNPQEMTAKDPTAKKLLAEYMTQMVNQNVTEDDARAILEYLRSIDNN